MGSFPLPENQSEIFLLIFLGGSERTKSDVSKYCQIVAYTHLSSNSVRTGNIPYHCASFWISSLAVFVAHNNGYCFLYCSIDVASSLIHGDVEHFTLLVATLAKDISTSLRGTITGPSSSISLS